jgi:hypothetical protein
VKENNFTSSVVAILDLTRAAECTFHYANMNATLAISLLSIASYSSIQMHCLHEFNKQDSKIAIAAFSTVNNNESDKYLANKNY